MPAIDPTWLPRENGAVIGSWYLLLRYSLSHSAGGVWFEHGVNREPMLGRQIQHLAIVMNDVLCAVRVEDGLCVPSLDEVRDELTARLDELQASCPDVVAAIIEAIGRAPEATPPADKPADKEPHADLSAEIDALATKKDALAFAELHKVVGLDDSMRLRDMKVKLLEGLPDVVAAAIEAIVRAPKPPADKPADKEPDTD